MKNILSRLREYGAMAMMLMLLCMTAASCGKDDIITIGANMLEVNGTEMGMGEATFLEYGAMGSGINCDVLICSGGMYYNVYNSEVTGSGIFLYFEIITSESGKLASGTYGFSASEEKPGVFTGNSYYVDTRSNGIRAFATGGRIKVSNSGNNYSLQFECEYENGTKITGHYEGVPSYYQRQ